MCECVCVWEGGLSLHRGPPVNIPIRKTAHWFHVIPLGGGGGGGSGVAKVSRILRHQGVQLILASSWARPAILVAGKGRGGKFYFFCFFTFMIPLPLSSLSLCFIYSTISCLPFHWEKTQNDPIVKLQHNQSVMHPCKWHEGKRVRTPKFPCLRLVSIPVPLTLKASALTTELLHSPLPLKRLNSPKHQSGADRIILWFLSTHTW